MKTYLGYLVMLICLFLFTTNVFSQKKINIVNEETEKVFSGTDCDFNNTGFTHTQTSLGQGVILVNNVQVNSHSFTWNTDGAQQIPDGSGGFYLDYVSSGIKNLCLVLTDTVLPSTFCDTTICHTFLITIDSCPAKFLQFNATSIQRHDTLLAEINFAAIGYTNYTIDYGDGSANSTQLSHIYDTAGIYDVCLTIIDTLFPGCEKTMCKQLTFTNDTTTFCHISNIEYNPVSVQNADSLIGVFSFSADGYTNYEIDYGDGQVSTELTHRYNAIGSYFTCLTLYNSNFEDCAEIICGQVDFVQDTTSLCDSVSCMLPGDSDHDLTVNNFDVLAIGLSFNRVGNVRPNASTQYVLQPSDDWSTTHTYGFNDKFADADGDGIIRAADATIVSQNYIIQAQNTFNHRTNSFDSLPEVKLQFDTLPSAVVSGNCVGAQLIADINVGNGSQNIDSAYGISFSVNYPFDNDSCFSVQIDATSGSWFQTNDPVLLFYKNIPEFKRVDVTVVRVDGATRSGNGKIGNIKFITEGDVFGIRRLGSPIQFNFSVTNVVAINNRGQKVDVGGSSTTVNFVASGIKQNKVEGLNIYPNLTTNKIFINAKESIESVKVLDLSGRIIYEFLPNKNDVQLDFSDTENGMYIIEIKGANSVSYEKIFKQ